MLFKPFALILSLIFVSFLALNAPTSVYATQDEEPEEEEGDGDEDTWVDEEDDDFVDVSREYYERTEVERGEREGDPDNPSPPQESGFGIGLSSVLFPPEGHPDNRPEPGDDYDQDDDGSEQDERPDNQFDQDDDGSEQDERPVPGPEIPAPKPGGDTATSTWPDGSVHTSVENVDGSHTVTHTAPDGTSTTEVVP